MARCTRSEVVAVESRDAAQVESWLLGRGYATSEQSDDGERTYFPVKDLTNEGRAQLQLRGATIMERMPATAG